ncbi:MAG: hypothetical protein R2838_09010 [Caldilineaceae bacterium]
MTTRFAEDLQQQVAATVDDAGRVTQLLNPGATLTMPSTLTMRTTLSMPPASGCVDGLQAVDGTECFRLVAFFHRQFLADLALDLWSPQRGTCPR